jgi:MFS family permease
VEQVYRRAVQKESRTVSLRVPLPVTAARRAIAALFFINGFAFATWVSRIPAVQTALHLSAASLGLALAGVGAGSLLSMPLTGWLIARVGSRPIVTIATLACSVTVVAPVLASNAALLGVTLFLFGAALGSMDVSMNAQGVELEQRYDRPIMAAFHAFYSLGGMSGAAVGGLIAARAVTVSQHFVLAGLILLVLAAVALPLLITTPPPPAHARTPLRVSRTLVALCVLGTCIMVCEGAMADWTPVYLEGVLRTGPGLAAAGYAVFSGAMTIGRLTGDWLTMQLGRVMIVRIGSALAAGGLAAALMFDSVTVALVGFICVGAGFSTIIPLVFSAAGRLDEGSAGPGLAAVTTAGYLGLLCGPPIIGIMAEYTSLRFALGSAVVLALCGVPLAKSVSTTSRPRRATA